jgi:calmodulin
LTHAEVAKRFEEFDADGDGFITVAECRAALDRLEREVSDGVVRESILRWDLDNDGVVDYFEFMDYFLNTSPPEGHAEVADKQFESISDLLQHCIVKEGVPLATRLNRQAKAELIDSFKLVDLDGDGFLSRDELRVALKSMSPNAPRAGIESQLNHMFAAADINLDGFIDLYEFSARAVQEGLYR